MESNQDDGSHSLSATLSSLYQSYANVLDDIEHSKRLIRIQEKYKSDLERMFKEVMKAPASLLERNAAIWRANPNSPELKSILGSIEHHIEGEFWKADDFKGWRLYTIELIQKNSSFLSLHDFLEISSPNGKAERSSLTSAISNALTTNVKAKKLAYVKISGEGARYYGLPKFFNPDRSLRPEFVRQFQDQFGVDAFLIEDQSI